MRSMLSLVIYSPSHLLNGVFCFSFLEHAIRIAFQRYIPTPDDILRVRVQTIGVEEHRLVLETGMLIFAIHSSILSCRAEDPGREWIFYDVEGRRGPKGKNFLHQALGVPDDP